MPYLTKSKFRLALECPTKLHYAQNKLIYHDENQEDPFLQALAEGGFQVGELAKFLFCDDPNGHEITIDTLDYDNALAATAARRETGGRVVIAEAAFQHGQCFVRTDLVVEEGNRIDIYEVKAKSWDEGENFFKTDRNGCRAGLSSDWSMYLYDVAFQKWVVQNANPGKTVRAFLVLADKTQQATIDGLNQFFRIVREGNRTRVITQEGVRGTTLGQIPLTIQPVDDACNYIYNHPVPIDLPGVWSFDELVAYLVQNLQANQRIWSPIGKKCRDCQFKNPEYPAGQQSGFHECWLHAGIPGNNLTQPLVLDIWGGKAGRASIIQQLIDAGKYRIDQVLPGDPGFSPNLVPNGCSLEPKERRLLQVQKSNNVDYDPHLDIQGLANLFQELPPPYHFIDFETSMVAIPFHAGRRPYEAIAFQYSYHRMEDNGDIAHAGQYISFDRGIFPNYAFLRSLMNDLGNAEGTIFRYHHHENSYLNHIYRQLQDETLVTVPDRDDLMAFIRRIAVPTGNLRGQWQPKQPMVDLYDFVLRHFYSLHAGGSNSIKDILPAVILSSDYLRRKYGEPVYATPTIPSLNFSEPHVWIRPDGDLNPYMTLPTLPEAAEKVQLELNDHTMTELKDGGAAMMAYAKLQFSDMTHEERALYRGALQRYCELDTMAMVMIWEYWGNEIGKWS